MKSWAFWTMALHFKCDPTELDQEQVLDYLHYLKSQSNTSKGKIIPILQDELGKINLPERVGVKHHICPVYKTGELITIMSRDPPSKAQLQALVQDILQRRKKLTL